MARAQNAVGRLRLVGLVTSSRLMISRALMASGVDCGFRGAPHVFAREGLRCCLGEWYASVFERMHIFLTFCISETCHYSKDLTGHAMKLLMFERDRSR